MNSIWWVIIFSSIAVAYLFLVSKILGKKQIAQLEFIDYVLGISIGSIAAAMATDTSDTPFYHYLIAMSIFFLFDILVTYLGRKGFWFKKFLKGSPIRIINDGKIDYNQLKKSKLDINELLSLCRTQGYFDISQVAFAFFENSGKLSVMPKGEYRPAIVSDLPQPIVAARLPKVLIIDGKIVFSNLEELNKNTEWLYEKLKISSKKQLKNLIFVQWDEEDSQMLVQYKQKSEN